MVMIVTVLSLSIVVISISALYMPISKNRGPVITIVPEGSGIIALVKGSKLPSAVILEELLFSDDILRFPVCE